MSTENLYHFDLNYLKNPKVFGPVKLYQIGRMYCTPATVINTHFHIDWFELTIVSSGSGTITTNGVPCHVTRGDIYFSYPCDVHKIHSDPNDPLKFDFFAFAVKEQSLTAELAQIVQRHYNPSARIFQDERIQSLIQNAIRECDSDEFGQHFLLTGIFSQVLVYLIRIFEGIPSPDKSDTIKDSEAFCYRIMNYIDTHIYSMKKLSEISDSMGYSFGHISFIFKKVTSHTLVEYYKERKFETARLLVEEQRLKVSEIAKLLNYSSVYAFSKAFHTWFGISPREYVIEHNKKKTAERQALEQKQTDQKK